MENDRKKAENHLYAQLSSPEEYVEEKLKTK